MADDAIYNATAANHLFTTDLYKVLAQETGNLFFSPISIQVILTLVFFGARGNTALQLARGLRLPEDKNVTEHGFSAIMSHLEKSDEITLKIANRIFLKNGFDVHEEFNHTAVGFKAGIEQVDFEQEEVARQKINGWVSQQTEQKINNIIARGVINELTRLLLVNAIYFKGEWLKRFKENDTIPLPFHLTSEATTHVKMMYTKDRFKYAEISELDSQVLSLPYKGRTTMLIVLPRQVDGLTNLEKNLTTVSIEDILSRVYRRQVYVYLPKFKLEYHVELKNPLIKLGITDIFERKANLTGISEEPLLVGKVVHKSFIEVNEAGTEAAAATVVLIARKKSLLNPVEEPVTFKADHPFIFFILDLQTKAVLFAGRYTAPPS